MAQIFVSHSAKDKELVAFLSKAFAATPVKAIFEEFEAILKGPANAQRIRQAIPTARHQGRFLASRDRQHAAYEPSPYTATLAASAARRSRLSSVARGKCSRRASSR